MRIPRRHRLLSVVLALAGCSSVPASPEDAGGCSPGDPACTAADTTAPAVSGEAPSGVLPAGTTSAILAVTTNDPHGVKSP